MRFSTGSFRTRSATSALLLSALLAALTLTAQAALAGSAKILLYHHVATGTPAATSITPERFDAHLEHLASEGYQVVPLQQIVDVLLEGGSFDSKWVAITFDDAYESVGSAAAPRLEARGWPYTVFVSTEYLDGTYSGYLDWADLRQLEASGATIANHSRSHDHLTRRQSDESDEAWKQRVAADVMHAQSRLDAELEAPARIFAYPFGEFDTALANLMTSLGFIALGQHSGPVGVGTSPYAIPRFPFATGFDGLRGFAEKLRTEYLPLADPQPPATVLAADAPAPELFLRLVNEEADIRGLNCFVNGQPNADVRWIDEQAGEILVTAKQPLGPGRSKYTCTAPVRSQPGSFYWFSHLFIKPLADGTWYSG